LNSCGTVLKLLKFFVNQWHVVFFQNWQNAGFPFSRWLVIS
jgi:hypothetical protein